MANSSDDQTAIGELRQLVREFVDQRDWQKFHDPKNLSMSLAIEAGELMEHFQWLTSEDVARGEGFSRAEVAEELADVACYVLALANSLEIDLSEAIAAKMVKNRIKYPPPH